MVSDKPHSSALVVGCQGAQGAEELRAHRLFAGTWVFVGCGWAAARSFDGFAFSRAVLAQIAGAGAHGRAGPRHIAGGWACAHFFLFAIIVGGTGGFFFARWQR